MINVIYAQAAANVAGEPVTIETNGTIWTDADHRDIAESAVKNEYDRIMAENAAATAAAIAHAKSLGFTDAMIAAMYPNLGAPNV